MITKEHSMTEEQAIKNKERFNTKREQLKESDIALWNYLCGDGDTRHLYNYYDLIDEGK
jgi:hypothetical protein